MNRALISWVEEQNDEGRLHGQNGKDLNLTYTIFGCMLVLSHNAFESPAWKEVRKQCDDQALQYLYKSLEKHLKVTHIAINKPIPLHDNASDEENAIRAPQNFTPLYGDFGPPTASSPPTEADFEAAFWVTAKQNDIYQTWAPRWTMFSRGNISEKARLLTLHSVTEVIEHGQGDGKGCAAVDLYAGIGYFAFSYLKAGMDCVLCWEINPWSIEGLRKGAKVNKWSSTTYEGEDGQSSTANQARLIIFPESNEHAASRISMLRSSFPPIRHVNCGLLPTSRGSWQSALEVLDPELGGWVHAHENFAAKEIDIKAEEVRAAYQNMVHEGTTVRLEQINRLKSYAPGVMHVVLDIHVRPSKPS
jgi:tRNA wybutosine-synthesizing protein 2